MGLAYDLAVNLGAASAGAALGATWIEGRRRLRYRHQREFWKFLEQPSVFVVGGITSPVLLNTLDLELTALVPSEAERIALVDFMIRYVRGQEMSGLVGRGDFHSIVRMAVRLGFLRLPVRPLILHPSEVGERRTGNLVLIGGSDVNPLTGALGPLLGCQLEARINHEGRAVVRDSRLGVEHRASEPGAVEVVDYGVLARGPNPYNRDSTVVLLAGAHGFGTIAATEVSLGATAKKQLRGLLRQFDGGFECLISYRRSDPSPEGEVTGAVTMEFARPLRPSSG